MVTFLSPQSRWPAFWKGLRAWNFLWAECLKPCKLEWQIRQSHSPHVEKSAEAFKHMSYETTQLGFFLSSVSSYYSEHWRCGFASCHVSLKSSWKEVTAAIKCGEKHETQCTLFTRIFLLLVKPQKLPLAKLQLKYCHLSKSLRLLRPSRDLQTLKTAKQRGGQNTKFQVKELG